MSGTGLVFWNGEWWPALAGGLALALLAFVWLAVWRRRVAEKVGEAALVELLTASVSPGRRTVKRVLWAFGLALAGVAALRPQFGMEQSEVSGRGIDLAVALDISNSMLVPDVAPDRLTGSVMEVSELLDRMEGGRVALVPFAGIAYKQTPLTSDFEAARIFLRDLKPSDVPVPGTAIGRALEVALDALEGKQEKQKKGREESTEILPFAGSRYKAVLLVTDGEDHGSRPLDVARRAADLGIRIYTVGVGSEVGDLVPRLNLAGDETADKLTDPDSGELVVSRLNASLLQEIAQATGGQYFHYTGRPIADQVYRAVEQLEKREYAAQVEELREDRFQFVLLPAVLLLLAELFLSERRGRRT